MNAGPTRGFRFVCHAIFAALLTTSGPALACLYAQSEPGNDTRRSRPLYIAIEKALEQLTRAEVAREQAAIAGNPATLIDIARSQCREAVETLVDLDRQTVQLLRITYATRPTKREGSWSVQELESLARNLQVQLARAYRNQAMCYPQKSVDRINSISQALAALEDVVNQPVADGGVWKARIEQAICLRLAGQFTKASESLQRWKTTVPVGNIASRMDGEQIYLAIARGDLQQSLQLAGAVDLMQPVVPETDEAVLQALLASQQLAPPQGAAELLDRAQQQLQRIAAQHGPYWQRRAESHFGQAMLVHLESDNPALLQYAARTLYARGEIQQAIAAYERIAALHALDDDAEQQFEALSLAATIARQHLPAKEAASRFQRLACNHAAHKDASAMHLVAIGLSASVVRKAKGDAQTATFDRYLELLEEHLRQWPDQPSAIQVQAWLNESKQASIARIMADAKASTGNRSQAIAIYRQLVAQTPDDPSLIEKLARLLAKSPDREDVREALALWTQIEKRSKPAGSRWTRCRQARLGLMRRLGDREQAEKLRQLTEILYPHALPAE